MVQRCLLSRAAAPRRLLLRTQSTQRVLATFTAWDLDGNGTLSKTEFSAISQVGSRGLVLRGDSSARWVLRTHLCGLCGGRAVAVGTPEGTGVTSSSAVSSRWVVPMVHTHTAQWYGNGQVRSCVLCAERAPAACCVAMQGAMSELFISRVFEEHVAPRRGATWPPPKQQQQQRQQSGPGSDGSASPTSPSRKPSSLPAIPGTSPPRSPASRPLAGTNSSNAAGRQQLQQGQEARSSSGGSWPPPLPPGAACARDEMDLLAFATFVLAWDHRNQPAAIPYFFKIFDIHHRVGSGLAPCTGCFDTFRGRQPCMCPRLGWLCD